MESTTEGAFAAARQGAAAPTPQAVSVSCATGYAPEGATFKRSLTLARYYNYIEVIKIQGSVTK